MRKNDKILRNMDKNLKGEEEKLTFVDIDFFYVIMEQQG